MSTPPSRVATVGVDTFTFHRFLGEVRFDEAPTEPWGREHLLDVLAALEVDVVSYETAFVTAPLATELPLVDAALTATGSSMVVAWGHPRGLRLTSDGPAWHALDEACAIAADLGHDLLRFVLGNPLDLETAPAADVVVSRLAAPLARLVERWADRGLRLALENHVALPMDTFVQLVDAVPDLGVVLDTGNVVRVGADLPATVRRLAPRVAMVHAKDFDLSCSAVDEPRGPWRCVPLGEGDLPVDDALDVLRLQGFVGPVCVELQELAPAWASRELDALGRSLTWLRTPPGSTHP